MQKGKGRGNSTLWESNTQQLVQIQRRWTVYQWAPSLGEQYILK